MLQKQPPEVFYKKGVLLNFEKTHRKAPVLESLLNKVAGLIAQISQENTFVRVPPFFPMNFANLLSTPCKKSL